MSKEKGHTDKQWYAKHYTGDMGNTNPTKSRGDEISDAEK
jgi:hypothetical protein